LQETLIQLAIFIMAGFLGFELISRVPNLLHTPLMSATNAIHGIILVGGMITIAADGPAWVKFVGFLAVFFGALMSATNAIHGIILVGGMITIAADGPAWVKFVGFLAVFFGALNVVGGFWVTNRMLSMFRPPKARVKKRKG
jgi:NAD(P) transhydrogenase subunit alpha